MVPDRGQMGLLPVDGSLGCTGVCQINSFWGFRHKF